MLDRLCKVGPKATKGMILELDSYLIQRAIRYWDKNPGIVKKRVDQAWNINYRTKEIIAIYCAMKKLHGLKKCMHTELEVQIEGLDKICA